MCVRKKGPVVTSGSLVDLVDLGCARTLGSVAHQAADFSKKGETLPEIRWGGSNGYPCLFRHALNNFRSARVGWTVSPVQSFTRAPALGGASTACRLSSQASTPGSNSFVLKRNNGRPSASDSGPPLFTSSIGPHRASASA